MARVIVHRILIGLLIVLPIAIFVVFFLSLYGPGDPIQIMLGQRTNPEVVERIRHQLGLDRPLWVQYGKYFWNILHGNFGESIKFRGQPVGRLLGRCVRVSAPLNLAALFVGGFLGIPLGLLAAFKHDTWVDRLIMVLIVAGISIPVFTIAPILLYFLAVKAHLLPPGGWDGIFSTKAVLPVLTLSLGPLAVLARQTRAAVLETLHQDYVRTAYGKGLSQKAVMVRHVLRNALIPVTTVIGLMLGGLVSGSLLTEMIFGIPGCGNLAVSAVRSRDYFLVAGFTLLYTVSIYLANLGVDIAYPLLDPRMRGE